MASRRVPKKIPRLKPRLYSDERIEKGKWFNRTDRPQVQGAILSEDIEDADGWIAFVPPKSDDIVHLKLRTELWRETGKESNTRPGGEVVLRISNCSPADAIREWFLVRETESAKALGPFDIGRLDPIWNFGTDPDINKRPCGAYHLQGRRSVAWSRMVDAHRIWADSGRRGLHPPTLLALLDPDSRLPFMSPPAPDTIPPENRWLYVAVDLARPLEEQFKEAKKHCRSLQDYAFALAGRRKPRPHSREVHRNVLIYTLHYSADLTVPEIAERVFPRERQHSAHLKVKAVLRKINEALRSAGFEPPKFGGQPKPPA